MAFAVGGVGWRVGKDMALICSGTMAGGAVRRSKYAGGVTLGGSGQSQVAGAQGMNAESQWTGSPNNLCLRRQKLWGRTKGSGLKGEHQGRERKVSVLAVKYKSSECLTQGT